jgi:hypothetical protein
MQMEKVETLVKRVLEKNRSAREDDNILYIEVIYLINPAYVNINFSTNFMNARKLGLPAFESVSRARRKLQAENENLRGSRENQKAREERQLTMMDYSLNKGEGKYV